MRRECPGVQASFPSFFNSTIALRKVGRLTRNSSANARSDGKRPRQRPARKASRKYSAT
jgi:hypothetical protein